MRPVASVDRSSHPAPPAESAAFLRQLCLDAGAADAGFVTVDRPELVGEKEHVLAALPAARTLIAFVVRTNPDALRSPPRSIANQEFHARTGDADDVARSIAAALRARGHRAVAPSSGFPMEMDRFPGRTWVVSHKTVAVAAGLGRLGIHRNLIHPRFGNFVLLGTVLTDAPVDVESRPIDFNPCLECKLCVAACPVGAIGADGSFQFNACYTHNYREFMGGFTDWFERSLRGERASDAENASVWQSLAFGPNYKAAYCMAVCPAGEDVIGPFTVDRADYVASVVRPLQARSEPVYVVAGSDAEAHARRRFPHKTVRQVSGLRPTSVTAFVQGLPLVFEKGAAAGTDACFHFVFTGAEARQVTVEVRRGRFAVHDGLVGSADVRVTADAAWWIACLRRERSMTWAVLTRRVRVRGRLSLLREFARCFPAA